MAYQVGNPVGVLHVRLAPRHVPDVSGIADDQGELPFQHGVDGTPAGARALHADMGELLGLEPVPYLLKAAGGGPRAHLLSQWLASLPTSRQATTVYQVFRAVRSRHGGEGRDDHTFLKALRWLAFAAHGAGPYQ